MKFEKVFLSYENEEILQACDFEFPMDSSCRLVFADDRQKFFFFHAITQFTGFAGGRFLFNDENVLDFSFEEFLKYRMRIGFGFSTRGLIQNRSLRQNLELPLLFHRVFVPSEVSRWVDRTAEYFELGPDLEKRPSEVSTSSQKATLILRAFIMKPELVFLDTPELMLSSKLHASLLQLIDDHRSYYNLKHLFFSTCDEDLSDCLAEKNIILRRKRLNLVEFDSLKRCVS